MIVYISLFQNGWTPLMIASFEGHTDILQMLIKAKAQISTQTEVHILCTMKHTAHTPHRHTLALFFNVRGFMSTQNGSTALHLAAQQGKADVVRLLLIEAQILINTQTEVRIYIMTNSSPDAPIPSAQCIVQSSLQ